MILKRGFPFLLATLFAVAAYGAEPAEKPSKDQPPEEGRHVDKANGFSIKFPKDWEKRENAMGMAAIGLSPLEGPDDKFRENVIVLVEEIPLNTSLATYYQENLKNMKTMLTDFKELASGAEKIGGVEAKRLVYSHRMGTVSINVCIYFLVKGNKGYSITCAAVPEAYDKYKDRFEEIARSFKLD